MKNKKGIVIGILCLTLVFMGIGYSLFSSTLNITGSSQSSGTFDVKITNVEVDENNTSSGATNTMDPIGANYAVTETTLSAEFNAPGDYITYDITVTNRGTIDAVISVDSDTDSSGAFELSCTVQEGTNLLANGGTTTFPCMMTFNENIDDLTNITTANMTVSIKAVQKGTYEAPPVEQTPTLPTFLVNQNGELTNYFGNSKQVVIPATVPLYTSTGEEYFYMDMCIPLAIEQYSMNQSDAESMCNNLNDMYEAGTLGTGGTPTEEMLKAVHVITDIYEDTGTTVQVTSIGEDVFRNMGLTSVDFSNATYLTEIGDKAFESNNLTGILTIPNSITSIGNLAFASNKIETINLGSGITHLGSSIFKYNEEGGVPTITDINIAMTETEWNNRSLSSVSSWCWQDLNVTPTFTG